MSPRVTGFFQRLNLAACAAKEGSYGLRRRPRLASRNHRKNRAASATPSPAYCRSRNLSSLATLANHNLQYRRDRHRSRRGQLIAYALVLPENWRCICDFCGLWTRRRASG